MNIDSKIYVAGHNGLAGSAIYRKLSSLGYKNIIIRTHKELDLENLLRNNLYQKKLLFHC